MADPYSNPLPPPPRPGAPPALAQEPAAPKSNAYFRALLATPRAERGSYTSSFAGSSGRSGGGGADSGASGAGAGDSAERREKKPKKPFKPKPAAAEDAKEDDGSGYRDRAEERRKGVNPDYDGFAADFSAGPSSGGGNAALTVDETKFLGGDVEHTHLVKGLDYALLQKVRTEESTKESEEAEEAKARAKMLRTKEFKTPLGRQVFEAVFRPPRRDVSHMFLPRRTAFVYDLEDGDSLDIPTTLHRSKADCPKPRESLLGVLDGAVLERLAKIMGYMRVAPGAKPGKRLKKRDKQRILAGGTPIGTGATGLTGLRGAQNAAAAAAAAVPGNIPPPPPAPADEEDDIFGGVGAEYELPEKRAGDFAAGGEKPDSYFDRRDEMRDLPAVPTGTAAGDSAAPPPPPDLPPPPPPPDMELDEDAAPGPAMPPPGYDYDYSAAYGAVPGADLQQQWTQQGYDASAYGGAAPMQYDAYGQPLAYQAAAEQEVAPDPNRELTVDEKEAGLGSVFKRDDERLSSMREKDEREKDPNFVSDAYAECYPAFHEFGTTVVDSDEEDLSHMDKKGEKGTTRADFNSEEEWQAHKGKQETLPKAAFQFGLKMADGRKTHKNLVGKAKANKLNNELNSIKDILEKKGGNYGRAFEEESELLGGSSGGGKPAKRKRVI